MVEPHEEADSTRARFDQIFEAIAVAMKKAANEADHSIASLEAERFGLTKTVPSKPVGTAWQTLASGLTIWFQWRYYDQSQAFSVQNGLAPMFDTSS